MGLTIYYKLSVKENIPSAAVRNLIERAALHAKEIGFAEVGEVLPADPDDFSTSLFVVAGKPEDGCFGNVPAKAGWTVEVWPGEGCESLSLALCQYQRRVSYQLRGKRGFVPTDYKGGWLFRGSCKTQYAAEHGWEHFLKCHKAVLQILEFCREIGIAVEVTDEGGFWGTRSEERLRTILQQYDGLMAAVAGVMKDAAEKYELSVESPIFERKDFERLEAAGQIEFQEQLSQLARVKLQ